MSPANLAMFDDQHKAATMARHNAKPTIHIALPGLHLMNLRRIVRDQGGNESEEEKVFTNSQDVLSVVFKEGFENDALHTAFSSFALPKPNSAPLSLRGVARHWRSFVDADSSLWSSVSGMQHSPNSPHPELIKRWIDRAGKTSPLNFHIAPRDYPDAGGNRNEDELTKRNLEIFFKHSGRWKNIAFELDNTLAEVYLRRLEQVPKPRQVEHLELLACRVTKMDVAARLFSTVESYGETVTKFLWGCPEGFWPLPGTISLPCVTVLGLDVPSLEDACRCLRTLEVPNLKELHICFTGDRGFSRWSTQGEQFKSLLSSRPSSGWLTLRNTSRTLEKLFIQDDEIDAEDVRALIQFANGNGVKTLALMVPHPNKTVVTTVVEELREDIERPTSVLERLVGLWNDTPPQVEGQEMDDGSVEISRIG